jgi:hypothetical protein
MFAGPNGSGKSSLKSLLPPALQGIYVNPDDLERGIRESGYLDLGAYIFDNSGEGTDRTWLAEITDGRELELKTDRVPSWFKRAVLDKIQPGDRA